VDGRGVRLTTGRLRTLLAVLAMTAGHALSMQRLTAAVWGDDPPHNPRRSLQTYAARLRAELGERVVSSQSGGLALDVGPDAVDALRFELLLDEASRQATPVQERQLLDEALGLWRGEPFEGVASGWLAETVAPRLAERRLAALERRADLDLADGRDAELVSELSEWTNRYPTREPLWVRLLVALDRGGRRAEALERYEQIRLRIADELGVDPSPELQQVYADLLAGRTLATGPASAADATAASVPQQLPAPPPAFVGRGAELTQLDDTDDGSAVVMIAIDGMAGVGKTTLAVHAARQLASRYPDGQLFLDLHGFTEGVEPVDPGEALDRMLRSLGVSGDQIPPRLDDRAALYRSRLADRRVLVLLDNAATEAQVTPLIPGSPGCLVLITSRRRLATLDQTRAVSLDVLPPADALGLFTKTAGADRVAVEAPESLMELVDLCGRLPLALRIAAARLRTHPTWTARHLIDLLADRQQRLNELEAGQRSVIAALDLSYQQLSVVQQRAYRLIGLHPGPDLDLHAAAALLDGDLRGTRRLLDSLLDTHVLEEPTPDRYQFHDLVRHHAAFIAAADETDAVRRPALDRLFTFYAHTAAVAMDAAYPFEQERRPRPPRSGHAAPEVGTADLAAGWLDVELPNLLAVARYTAENGWLDHPPRLATILDRHLMSRSRTADAESLHQLALSTAGTAGDPVAEINALVRLGLIHRRGSRHPQAEATYRRALQLAREHGYRPGKLDALHGLGQIQRLRTHYAEATDSFRRALNIADMIEYPAGRLEALLGIGHMYQECKQHEQAADDFDSAVAIARAGGYLIGELTSLLALGEVHRKLGRYQAATGCYALPIWRAPARTPNSASTAPRTTRPARPRSAITSPRTTNSLPARRAAWLKEARCPRQFAGL
jgi:DNA-binding SARP family transcriptional activator/tetratricopeptide (TPR) repeat protein